MSELLHDLIMLRLKNMDVSKMSSEQIYYEYKKLQEEMLTADKKYAKEHPRTIKFP